MLSRLTKRFFSVQSTFYASDLEITKVPVLNPDLKNAKLGFGVYNSDLMFQVQYNEDKGWGKPSIGPFKDFQINPFNATLHYSLSCFEGMKLYKGEDGKFRLFRPMDNMTRFLKSNQRLAFAPFEPAELLKCLIEYCKMETHWVPGGEISSLYLRPTAVSMSNKLGVHKSDKNMIFIVASPVGSYFSGKINLCVFEDYWRGTPYSAAAYKISANYAPTVQIGHELAKKGFSQALWTYNDQLLESGATNIFFVIKTKDGKEVVTHPTDGSILPGVTRQSIIDLHNDLFPSYKLSERPFTITEFLNHYNEGTLLEVFVTGTASVIQRVSMIEMRGQQCTFGENGEEYSGKMKQFIIDIQRGVTEHPFAMLLQ